MQNPQIEPQASADRTDPAGSSGTEDRLDGQFVNLVTTDAAEFEIALRPWELLCKPQASGPFHHHLVMLQTPFFLMYREKFSLPLHIQGLSPPDMLGIGIPMHLGREARYWGVRHEGHSLPATLPGALDAKIAAGHFQLVIFVHLKSLEGMLSGQLVERLMRAAKLHLLQVPSPALRRLATWANQILDQLGSAHESAASSIMMEAVYRQLIDNLAMLAGAMAPVTDVSTNPARQRGLQRALEYFRYDHSANISAGALPRCRYQ